MEVSPRAGGNRLSEILNYATDVDIINAEVCKSIGLDFGDVHEPNYNGHYAIYNLHSSKDGIFKKLEIEEAFEKKYLVEKELRVTQGDKIYAFTGANNSLGTMFLKTGTRQEMNEILENIDSYVKIVLE